jgi:hypothetical protein
MRCALLGRACAGLLLIAPGSTSTLRIWRCPPRGTSRPPRRSRWSGVRHANASGTGRVCTMTFMCLHWGRWMFKTVPVRVL